MFDEVVFPLMLETATSSPEYSTTVIPTRSGAEQRISNWQDARVTFNAALGVRSKLDIKTLLNFFRARKGRARGFLVKDLIDCDAQGDVFGVGDGEQTEFQLVRVYGDAGNSDIRPIYKPILGTVQIFKTGSTAPLSEGGYGATADCEIESFSVAEVTIVSGGQNYTSAPTVQFQGGGGENATGTATLDLTKGKVKAINITNIGRGYGGTVLPTVTFTASGVVQTVTLGAGNTGGTFTLTLSGQTTSAIAYNATALQVQTAIGALSNVGAANVLVTGNNGGPYRVVFIGTLLTTDVAQMTATASLTGGTNTVTIVKQARDTTGFGAAGQAALSRGKCVVAVTVTSQGSGYTEPPWVVIDGGSGVGATAVAVLGTGANAGKVVEVIVTSNGNGFFAVPTVTIGGPPTGSGGSTATATAVIARAVAAITLTNTGQNYTLPPLITITGGLDPLDVPNVTATAESVIGFPVQSVTVTNGGEGYDTAPVVTFSGGNGFGATGTTTLEGGGIASVELLTGGTKYQTPPLVAFVGGGGANAAANTTIAGSGVMRIDVTNGGSGYTTAPSVTLSGGNGANAQATAVVSGGQVVAVNVTNGGTGYTGIPTVAFGGPGANAAAVAKLSGSSVTNITLTAAGEGYTTKPVVKILNQDEDYSVNYKNGLVTFVDPPAEDVILTWYGQYYIPCRFLEDALPADEVFFDLVENRAAGGIPNVGMIEIREFE